MSGVRFENKLQTYLEIGEQNQTILYDISSLGFLLSYTAYMDTKERREVEDKIQLGEQMGFALQILCLDNKYLKQNNKK